MLEKYTDQINHLGEWYTRAKVVAIRAESMDLTGTSYIQPLHEQRYSFDHFMRAIEYDQENEELAQKAINSSIGHLQRCYSDSIEWMLMSVKDEYAKILDDYDTTQITNGFPEYYQSIRPALLEMTEVVDEYKISKSVEKATTPVENPSEITELTDEQLQETNKIAGQFLSMNIADRLCEFRKKLYTSESALIEIKKKDKKTAFKDKVLLPIITGVIGALLCYLCFGIG